MTTPSSGRTEGSRFAPGQLILGIVIGMSIYNILSSSTHPAFTTQLNTSKGQPHDITNMMNNEYKDHNGEGIKLNTNETSKPNLKQRKNHPKAMKMFNNGTKKRPINRIPRRNGVGSYFMPGRPYMLNKPNKGRDTNSTEWMPRGQQQVIQMSRAIPKFDPVVLDGSTASHPCGKCHFIGHIKRCFKKKEITDFDNERSTFDGDSSCADIPLPFDNHTAKNCWPNLFILPSYPTNGNGYVQNTFTQLTNLMTMTVYGQREYGSPTIDLSSPSVATDLTEKIWYFQAKKYCQYNTSTSAILPTSGRATLAKTHMGCKKPNKMDKKPNEMDSPMRDKPMMTLGSTLSGVVRLARNPGDQLLRNMARWRYRPAGADRSSSSAMMERASDLCKVVLYTGFGGWTNFHRLWNTFEEMNPSLPHLILNYELISHPQTATREFGKLLSFVNETAAVEDVDALIQSVVKEPTYDQGGQFAQYCGIKAARQLHKKTQHFSKKLGYEFDDDTGKWFLHNHQ